MQLQNNAGQFLLNAFRRHYYKVKEAYNRLVNIDGAFSYQYTLNQERLQSKIEVPNEKETIRFMVLMRRFLNPVDKLLYYKNVWSTLKENFPEAIPSDRVSEIEELIEEINKGPFKINIDQRDVNAENIYHIVANGEYFGKSDEQAITFLQILANTPFGHLFLYEFYNYNLGFFHVASILFDIFLEVKKDERYSNFFYEESATNKRCIYCLSNNETFTSEEHIVPESLGNYDTILPKGVVCDKCNNEVLSGLDAALVESDLISFLKTLYMPYTKEGKLPQAEYQNVSIKKVRPSHIVFTDKSKKESVTVNSREEDGSIRFTVNMKGRKKFDPVLIGRALYKIGLGMIAFFSGRDAAYDSKYDAARAFILGEQDFPNNLFISDTTKPHPQIYMRMDIRWGGTCIQVNIYGLVFIFNLETTPVLEVTEEQLKQMNYTSYSLRST